MKKAILMMLLTIVSNSAGADWLFISSAATSDFYVDPTSAEFESAVWGRDFRKFGNDIVKVRQLTNFKVGQQAEGVWIQPPGSPREWNRLFLSAVSEVAYDCQDKELRMYRYELYSGPMGGGSLVGQRWWSTRARYKPQAQWEPVAQGSIGDAFLRFACTKKK